MLEKNKKPGVQYVIAPDGIELPVVDVSHPAFALTMTDPEQKMLTNKFLQQGVPFRALPSFLRTRLLRFLLRGSVLARGIGQAQGTFLNAMNTYLLKLGPEMLGAYANPIDRKIAVALPTVAVRLRLQDMAHLMADTLIRPLGEDLHRPLYFLNIAGGTAIDSMNALILLQQKSARLLAQRSIFLDVLDLEEVAPQFGEAALTALCSDGGPLRGIRTSFRHIPYDWSQASALAPVLSEVRAKEALAICSSEGGLFEYGSDDEIVANLTALHTATEVIAVVGSVTRADEPIRRLHETSRAATRPRGLSVFLPLAQGAGWNIDRVIERPFSDHVVLTRLRK